MSSLDSINTENLSAYHQPMAQSSDSNLTSNGQAIPEVRESPQQAVSRSDDGPVGCRCRFDLISHVHSLEDVMQERPKQRIDNMFRVTGDVIGSCRSAITCANCHISPVDLVFILSVFQQTAYCFQQISHLGLNNDDFIVGIGDYRVLLNDDATTIKSMLVLNLVAQAKSLLDALDTQAQSLFLFPSSPDTKSMGRSPACLNQLNLEYVKQVTTNFQKLFKIIVNVFTMDENKG